MAIYISKNAIQNIPLDPEDGNKERRELKSALLKSDPYLVALVNSPNSTSELKVGIKDHPSIRTINIAFDVIRYLDLSAVPVFNDLNFSSTDFTAAVENNVKLFQNWAGLPVTGVIDADTVVAIDDLIDLNEFVFSLNKEYIGKQIPVYVTYSDKVTSQPNAKYEITFIAHKSNQSIPQTITVTFPLEGNVIKKEHYDFSGVSPETMAELNVANPSIEGMPILGKISSSSLNILYQDKNQQQAITNDINGFVEDTPPSLFGNMGKTYKVSNGENFSDIVLAQYYNTGEEYLRNPEDDSIIFTFPNRQPLNNREEDARFQFYLNLLYYSNTQEVDGNVESWGMKIADNYSRYLVNQLEEYNLFNNNYEPSDPETALPNYYRFLKHMEIVNPDSEIEFDDGNCLNFQPGAGKNIVIPSRQFADSIYYLLNYRHGEMLTAVGNKMEQVKDAALSTVIGTLQSALNTLTGITQEVKEDAVALYTEAADFFITGLDFLIDFLKKYWPRGAGGKIVIDIGVTWGIPLATDGSSERTIWRKVSKDDEFVLCFGEVQKLEGGADVAASVGIGLYSGVGKKKKTLGVNLGAGVDGLAGLELVTEYEFPLRADETMLMAGMMVFLGPNMTNLTASVLNFFDIMNLEPRKYLTKAEIKLSATVNLWAKADLGLTDSGKNNIMIERGQSDAEMDSSKSYGFLDNILHLLPGAGIMGEYAGLSGVSMTTELKYDNNPNAPEIDARMFSEQSVEIKFFTSQTLTTGLLGNLFQKLLFSAALPTGGLFDINFDTGILVAYKTKMTRNTNVRDITLADVKVDPNSFSIVEGPGGTLQFNKNGTNIFSIQTSLQLGMFDGNVEELAGEGTEARLKINFAEFREIYNNYNSYPYTFENIKKLLIGFEYRKKVGIFRKDSTYVKGKLRKDRHNGNEVYTEKTIEIFKSASGTDNETQLLVDLFTKMSKIHQYADSAMALDIKMEVDFATMLSVFEFYIKMLYCKYSLLPQQRQEFQRDLDRNRSSIEKEVESRLITETGSSENSSLAFYNYLFAISNTYVKNGVTINFDGLNGYINNEIIKYQIMGNYAVALTEFIKCPPSYNNFLKEITPISDYDVKDIGIFDFISYFTALSDLGGLTLDIEGLVGVSAGINLRLATARIMLGGFAQLTYKGTIFENGALTDLGPSDVLRAIFEQIDKLLARASEGKKVPVRTLIDIVE